LGFCRPSGKYSVNAPLAVANLCADLEELLGLESKSPHGNPPRQSEDITLRTPQGHQATVALDQVPNPDGHITLQAQMTLEFPMPDPDADLPRRLEAAIEHGGQVLKRRWFQQAIERADRELERLTLGLGTGPENGDWLPAPGSPGHLEHGSRGPGACPRFPRAQPRREAL